MHLTIRKTGDKVLIDDEDCIHAKAMQLGRDGIIYVRWIENKKQIRRALHRQIMGNPRGMEVDHINGNRFDNRKENLRICTPSQNTCNRSRPRKKLLHPFRGVAFFGGRNLKKPWVARIKVNRKYKETKYFETIEEAAKYYDLLALKYHGEFARFNFPKDK